MEKNPATSTSQTPGPAQKLEVMFELAAEEGEDDAALINMVGHETVSALQQEGYTARPPVYTGQKGAEGFLVEFVTMIQQTATTVWNDHMAIAEGIADLSGLITIFGGILPVLKRMWQAHEKHVSEEKGTTRLIKMMVEIDGAPLVIEASDITQADAALKLALKYRSAHPAAATQVTTKSKVKVRGQVPARKRRPRR